MNLKKIWVLLLASILLLKVNLVEPAVAPTQLFLMISCQPMAPQKGPFSYKFERGHQKLLLHKGYCSAA